MKKNHKCKMHEGKDCDCHIKKAFNLFIAKYGREFLTNEEFQARYNVFKANYEHIEKRQSEVDFKLSLN